MKFVFLMLFTIRSFACVFTGADQVVSTNSDAASLFTSNNCNKVQVAAFNDLVKDANGVLKSKFISRNTELNNVVLRPSNVFISSLSSMIKKELSLPDSFKVEINSKIYNKNLLRLQKGEKLSFHCPKCSSPGSYSIKITRTTTKGPITSWAKITILSPVKALVATKSLGVSFEELIPSNFKITTIYTTNSKELVTDKESILFSRLNRSINEGQPLYRSQISQVQLTKPGTPVQIDMTFKGLKMKSMATPLDSGFLGQTIRLRNTKNNKVFSGKVVGKNKVKVVL